MESETNTHAPTDPGTKVRWWDRLRRRESLVPAFAVVTVVVAALVATVMVTRSGRQESGRPAPVSKAPPEVVRAPPVVVRAPPLKPLPKTADQARPQNSAAPVASNALGAGAACRNCGVVESVALLDRQNGYQMRIRMDDGSVRTVAQRGALAAGSRVLLQGGSVRAVPAPPRQG